MPRYSFVHVTYLDGGTYRLQNSYAYYKLESKATSNFYVTSKKLGRFEIFFCNQFKFLSSIIDPKLSSIIAGHLLEVRILWGLLLEVIILCGRLLLRTTSLSILDDKNF